MRAYFCVNRFQAKPGNLVRCTTFLIQLPTLLLAESAQYWQIKKHCVVAFRMKKSRHDHLSLNIAASLLALHLASFLTHEQVKLFFSPCYTAVLLCYLFVLRNNNLDVKRGRIRTHTDNKKTRTNT